MPKSREKTRANKKLEEKLEKKDYCGIKDPTPYAAILLIRAEQRGRRKWTA